MKTIYRLVPPIVSIFAAPVASACEPVVPFIQATLPALALSRSLIVLMIAVTLKSVLFAVFERRLTRPHAVFRMFLGNVLTSFVGLLVAAMLASSPAIWLVGVPVVYFLCWLPAKRLVHAAPLKWLGRVSPAVLATLMTTAFVASCILFMAGQGALETHQLALYWIIKLTAILFALLASITLTTIWEEWVIWRLSSRPKHTNYLAPALRANLYVLLLVMTAPAMFILPKRLQNPDFLGDRHHRPALKQSAATAATLTTGR